MSKVILLCGPTACGKTNLSLKLAEYFPIEIVSVDSALIYKDLNIGTAKPSLVELNKVRHHLIDIISPLDSYSVKQFLCDCELIINQIHRRGNIPILVGGTMMYYNAFINGISDLPEANQQLRAELDQDIKCYGNLYMHQKLQKLDEVTATKIAYNDTQRLQRALEVCLLTGKPMSQVQQEFKIPGLVNQFDTLAFGILVEDRLALHQRIGQRFQQMLELNLPQEVASLRLKYPELTIEHNSMRCVGYRQTWDYLDGNLNFKQYTDSVNAATRQLAKRQITWMRSLSILEKLDISNFADTFTKISNKCRSFLS